ncbi:uncharacterized protein LODBEIA_P20180 [Lodderomyces beijingensis]|uniref:Uncharacterized protein n=1 Tax=Lodderomyces beijingensis TaxID=1775926 RepID=A0ABP0ZI01_9ASCO
MKPPSTTAHRVAATRGTTIDANKELKRIFESTEYDFVATSTPLSIQEWKRQKLRRPKVGGSLRPSSSAERSPLGILSANAKHPHRLGKKNVPVSAAPQKPTQIQHPVDALKAKKQGADCHGIPSARNGSPSAVLSTSAKDADSFKNAFAAESKSAQAHTASVTGNHSPVAKDIRTLQGRLESVALSDNPEAPTFSKENASASAPAPAPAPATHLRSKHAESIDVPRETLPVADDTGLPQGRPLLGKNGPSVLKKRPARQSKKSIQKPPAASSRKVRSPVEKQKRNTTPSQHLPGFAILTAGLIQADAPPRLEPSKEGPRANNFAQIHQKCSIDFVLNAREASPPSSSGQNVAIACNEPLRDTTFETSQQSQNWLGPLSCTPDSDQVDLDTNDVGVETRVKEPKVSPDSSPHMPSAREVVGFYKGLNRETDSCVDFVRDSFVEMPNASEEVVQLKSGYAFAVDSVDQTRLDTIADPGEMSLISSPRYCRESLGKAQDPRWSGPFKGIGVLENHPEQSHVEAHTCAGNGSSQEAEVKLKGNQLEEREELQKMASNRMRIEMPGTKAHDDASFLVETSPSVSTQARRTRRGRGRRNSHRSPFKDETLSTNETTFPETGGANDRTNSSSSVSTLKEPETTDDHHDGTLSLQHSQASKPNVATCLQHPPCKDCLDLLRYDRRYVRVNGHSALLFNGVKP